MELCMTLATSPSFLPSARLMESTCVSILVFTPRSERALRSSNVRWIASTLLSMRSTVDSLLPTISLNALRYSSRLLMTLISSGATPVLSALITTLAPLVVLHRASKKILMEATKPGASVQKPESSLVVMLIESSMATVVRVSPLSTVTERIGAGKITWWTSRSM